MQPGAYRIVFAIHHGSPWYRSTGSLRKSLVQKGSHGGENLTAKATFREVVKLWWGRQLADKPLHTLQSPQEVRQIQVLQPHSRNALLVSVRPHQNEQHEKTIFWTYLDSFLQSTQSWLPAVGVHSWLELHTGKAWRPGISHGVMSEDCCFYLFLSLSEQLTSTSMYTVWFSIHFYISTGKSWVLFICTNIWVQRHDFKVANKRFLILIGTLKS